MYAVGCARLLPCAAAFFFLVLIDKDRICFATLLPFLSPFGWREPSCSKLMVQVCHWGVCKCRVLLLRKWLFSPHFITFSCVADVLFCSLHHCAVGRPCSVLIQMATAAAWWPTNGGDALTYQMIRLSIWNHCNHQTRQGPDLEQLSGRIIMCVGMEIQASASVRHGNRFLIQQCPPLVTR